MMRQLRLPLPKLSDCRLTRPQCSFGMPVGRLRCNPRRRDRFPRPRKQSAAGRSHAQLRHLSGEFAEHLVNRFCKLIRILFWIIA
jgi:hypothetical protein